MTVLFGNRQSFIWQSAKLSSKKMPLSRPMPGALHLTQSLHNHGIKQAVAPV
jgi:hypothetical protein